jgi:acyl-CoA synthetase (AMP-forming)/AMP-acid ligase II
VLTTSYWPADARAPLDEITVGDLLRRVAGQVPDRVALVDGQAAAVNRRRWSYTELLAIAGDVAGALLARFEPGERVAIWETNRPEWVMRLKDIIIRGGENIHPLEIEQLLADDPGVAEVAVIGCRTRTGVSRSRR